MVNEFGKQIEEVAVSNVLVVDNVAVVSEVVESNGLVIVGLQEEVVITIEMVH